MKTAIIILNWNGKALLERFIPSVISSSKDLASIYLADNASTDDSVAYCMSHFPEVKIIQNSSNGGYARGYNEALRNIKADLFVLLNSDVKTPHGWLEPMINLFETNSNIGAAQPKILDLKNKDFFEYAGAAGGFVDSLGYPYCRGRIFDTCEKDTGQYDDTLEVHWASGACLFVRASIFQETRGFDEDYFAHQEEIDLCWRILNLGYKIVASGDSYVYHLGGGTLSSLNPKKTFYNFRNTLFNVVKNVPGIKFLLIVFIRLVLDGIAGVRFLLQGKFLHLWAILKAHFSFYYHIPSLLKKRRLQKIKKSYASLSSIVYSYFIKKKKSFSEL